MNGDQAGRNILSWGSKTHGREDRETLIRGITKETKAPSLKPGNHGVCGACPPYKDKVKTLRTGLN